MMRNWKQIAGLAGVLIALGALATWDEWKTKQDEKEKETKGLLLQIKPDAVVGIALHSTGDSDSSEKTPNQTPDQSKTVDVSLKLNAGKWEITSPIQTAADQQTVSDLIKNVTEYKTESEVASSKDKWGQFGLTNPRRSIELETNDGKKTTFMVGINAPVGFSTYTATSTSEKVYAGSQYIATSTGKTLFDLREKKILSASSADVSGLKLIRKSEPLALAKVDGKWTIEEPTKIAAETSVVNNLVDDIIGLKAAEFFDKPDKGLTEALTEQKATLKIGLSGEKFNSTLMIAEFNGATYAQVAGQSTIVKLHDDAKGKLSKTLKDLRNKNIFSFQSAEVKSIVVDGESFTKIADDWYTAADAGKFGSDGKFSGKPEDKPKAASHIRGLIVDLEYAKADDVLDSASPVAKKLPKAPKHQIKLGLNNKDAPLGVDIWLAQDNSEMIYIRSSGSPQIYKSKRSIIASLTPAAKTPAGNEAISPNTPEGLSN